MREFIICDCIDGKEPNWHIHGTEDELEELLSCAKIGFRHKNAYEILAQLIDDSFNRIIDFKTQSLLVEERPLVELSHQLDEK